MRKSLLNFLASAALSFGLASPVAAQQNASFALRMADRAYVIESGSVVLSGTAQELSDEPRVRQNYLGY